MPWQRLAPLLLGLWLTAGPAGADGTLPPAAARKIDFGGDVVPLLSARCFRCHQGAGASAGHRLDLRAELLGETNARPLVVPGRSDQSRLIHVVAGLVPNKRMPRQGPPLTAEEVGVLRAWIDQGLAWDEAVLPATAEADHWAFRPVARVEPPPVKNKAWVCNPIDAFIAAQHEEKGLTPAPEADRRTLIRRLSLDLLGLPPTPEEIDTFVNDPAPDAYERLVDRLLDSPHYGERWARHWLDVARWAESEGFESNHLRPYAWRYRDWVVRSFQQDMPFPDFIRAQVAGDEVTPYSDDNLIATGFLAGARLSTNEEDMWLQRNDMLVDVVNATASAFLGLTLSCAQCHNHKYDPLTARDYYRFQGFFLRGQPVNVALRDPKVWADYRSAGTPGYEEAVRLAKVLFEQGRAVLVAEARQGLSPGQRAALDTPADRRDDGQERLAREADLQLQFSSGKIESAIPAPDRKLYAELKARIARLEAEAVARPQTLAYYSPVTSPHALDVLPMKGFYPLVYQPAELARLHPYLLRAGDVHDRGFRVDVGWPAVFGPTPKAVEKHPRLTLATWLGSPRNPLTARVWVNRLWQYHFGRGIVATAGDFGRQGEPPTHPELLDWLADQFTKNRWSTKHVHRLIVTSRTYRQSTAVSTAAAERDPDNRLWTRWQPRRLEAEAIRDSLLAVSGELDARAGGPSDPPEKKSLRRSLYLLQKRDQPTPAAALFDGPTAVLESCARRYVSTVPLQALYLLNNEYCLERAAAQARRVEGQAGDSPERRIDATFRLALGRLPDDAERDLARRFFASHGGDPARALVQFCQAVLNTNEFVYIE